jgi:hypothetical protein
MGSGGTQAREVEELEAMQTLTVSDEALSEDVGNIVSLEHVNTQIPDQSLATLFYIVGLGFTRDPYMNVGLTNMWINIGDQQFHLPTGKAQVLRGHTGLVVPDVGALKDRLASIEGQLQGTAFAVSTADDVVSVRSPWGNEFRCYAPGTYGAMQLGVPYVELTVPAGKASAIARFYETVFNAPSHVEDGAAFVDVGARQQLVFRETDAVPDYDGHHIAIYIANFSSPFQWLQERGLITESIRNHQFRFQDIVDPDDGSVAFTLEHEVRSSRHPGFRRQLVNRGAPPF